MKDKNIPLIILTIAIFIFLILPGVFKEGLFMDGLMYGTIANNLSNGLGSFWIPHFSSTFLPEFHEHPPLAFGIQSIFFSLFGSGFWVEKLYSFFTAVLQAVLIISIWRNTIINSKNLFWLPLLLWITIPLCFWSYKNNMLENTMAIFTTTAILFQVLAFKNKLNYTFLVFSGLCIFSGFLSKGFPAFFPIVFPAIHWLLLKRFSFIKYISSIIIICLSIAVFFAVLFFIPGAIESFDYYLNTQVAQSLKGERIVMERYYILKKLFLELIPSLGIVLIVSVIARIKKIKFQYERISWFWVFLLTGISASFPIVISPKQLGFYLVPSLPFFALAFSTLIVNPVDNFIPAYFARNKKIILGSVLVVLVSIVFSVLQVNSYERDEDKIKDVKSVGEYIGRNQTLSICTSMFQDWALHGYFARYYNIGIEDHYQSDYLLSNSECTGENFVEQNIQLINYTFYRLEKEN